MIRKHLGIKQQQLAEATNLTQPAISRLENGEEVYSSALLAVLTFYKDKINLDPASYVGNVREEVLELYAKYKVIMARFTPGPVKNFFVWYRERTIEGNPTMSSDSYKGNLEEVKEKIKDIRKK